jgi:hypothetical protein
MAPSGDGGRKHADVIESDAFADGVVGDGRVCSVEGNGVGFCCGFGAGGRRGQVETPQAGAGRSGARQDGAVVLLDCGGGCCENGFAAVVAEETDRNEGAGGERRKNVCVTSCGWKRRDVEERCVAGVDVATVWESDSNAGGGQEFADVRAICHEVMTCAACVGDGIAAVVSERSRGRGPINWEFRFH